jgi:hypothetical protein
VKREIYEFSVTHVFPQLIAEEHRGFNPDTAGLKFARENHQEN